MEILITRSYLTDKIFSMIWTDWMPALPNMTHYVMALTEKERGAEVGDIVEILDFSKKVNISNQGITRLGSPHSPHSRGSQRKSIVLGDEIRHLFLETLGRMRDVTLRC